jgi:hypothetical protein
MPIRSRVACPGCGAELRRKPGGRCPACGTSVVQHVRAEHDREERIEKIVAVVGTVLVVGVLAMTSGVGLVEGALAYGGAGAAMFYLARKTF